MSVFREIKGGARAINENNNQAHAAWEKGRTEEVIAALEQVVQDCETLRQQAERGLAELRRFPREKHDGQG